MVFLANLCFPICGFPRHDRNLVKASEGIQKKVWIPEPFAIQFARLESSLGI